MTSELNRLTMSFRDLSDQDDEDKVPGEDAGDMVEEDGGNEEDGDDFEESGEEM